MASTNKTTNYELSQYIGTDKPTYLTDYNQDMSKIDAGIHAAKSEADTNSNSIGDLTSLTTTAKTSLVASINEVDADVATNTNNIATNTSNIATNTTHIGTLTNLTTTAKTDLVVASNEINAKVGTLSNLKTTAKTSTVAAINELKDLFSLIDMSVFNNFTKDDMTSTLGTIQNETSMTVASNSNGSLAKIYGYINISHQSGNHGSIKFNSTLRPESNITVNCLGEFTQFDSNGSYLQQYGPLDVQIATNGEISITPFYVFSTGTISMVINPSLIFVKDFGDTPIGN